MALFTKQGIDQAISTLGCQPNTLRARLLEYIRASYITADQYDSLTNIPAPEIIEKLWGVHTADEIKQKRKNLSGLKSSINKLLKTAIEDGSNPEGIIINKDNVFTVSEEKKNSLIEKLGLLGGKESIADIMSAVQTLIKDSINQKQISDINNLIKQLDDTRKMLSGMNDNEIGGKNDIDTGFNEQPNNELAEIDDDEIVEVGEDGNGAGIDENGEATAEFDVESDEKWDNVEIEDEFEEVDEDEIIDLDEDSDEAGIGEEGVEVAEIDDAPDDDWDNFEVEDEFEEVDEDEIIDLDEDGDGAGISENEEETDVIDDAPDDDWDNFEVEDEFEEVDENEIIDLDENGDGAGIGEDEEETAVIDDAPDDDWDNFEVEDELEDIDDEIITDDANGDEDGLGAKSDLGHSKDPSTLSQSLNLSQYIEPKEALDLGEVLQESNEEYVKQILERFMPKFIKIPAGSYPVGAPKKRPIDRSIATVQLPSFFIGQHPITNDIFDFFIRETGYITSAEKAGYGLVTCNRCHSSEDRETGKTIIIINQGTSTTQISGANWMHPNGTNSSLEGKGSHPVVQVSFKDTQAFAAWAGKRLPTEDEWEVAARGKDGDLYPWGNQYEPLANLTDSQQGTTSQVGKYGRLSLSPFGLLDMIGNVAEWTSSIHTKGHNLIITKGGSWASEKITSAQRGIESKDTWTNTIGFRCCVSNHKG